MVKSCPSFSYLHEVMRDAMPTPDGNGNNACLSRCHKFVRLATELSCITLIDIYRLEFMFNTINHHLAQVGNTAV